MEGEHGYRPAEDVPAPRPRRAPRRATGGTFAGEEPRLPGPDGPAPETPEEAADGPAGQEHERWLRAQRPPHWG